MDLRVNLSLIQNRSQLAQMTEPNADPEPEPEHEPGLEPEVVRMTEERTLWRDFFLAFLSLLNFISFKQLLAIFN